MIFTIVKRDKRLIFSPIWRFIFKTIFLDKFIYFR